VLGGVGVRHASNDAMGLLCRLASTHLTARKLDSGQSIQTQVEHDLILRCPAVTFRSISEKHSGSELGGFARLNKKSQSKRDSGDKEINVISLVASADAEACLRIYAPFVQQTIVSLETTVPTIDGFASRIAAVAAFYPFLTWKENGELLGFVYASRLRDRAAYDWICESAIYVDERARGMGIGTRLYTKLFDCLRAMNIVSIIGVTRSGSKSAEFHRRIGFKPVGRIPLAGFKLDQWCDVEFWQYQLASPRPVVPSPVIPFPAVTHTISLNG
jgi:L-amino acid N-acyltransferase YncA